MPKYAHCMGAKSFISNDEIDSIFKGRIWSPLLCLENVAEDHVAHAEAEGGEVDVAEIFEEGVVAAAAGDGAVFAGAIEDFPDDAGVVGEAADDGVVAFDVVVEAAVAEAGFDGVEAFAFGGGGVGEEGEDFFGVRAELFGGFFRGVRVRICRWPG